jgi:hypothetical protein
LLHLPVQSQPLQQQLLQQQLLQRLQLQPVSLQLWYERYLLAQLHFKKQ